jgi:hypothetical protein
MTMGLDEPKRSRKPGAAARGWRLRLPRDWHVSRTAELEGILQQHAFEDFAVERAVVPHVRLRSRPSSAPAGSQTSEPPER